MNFYTHQIEEALRQYYGMKVRGAESIRVSDVKHMEGGFSHNMYSFHLEYVEKAKRHGENLILRMGDNEDLLSREFRALEKLNSTSIPVPKVYDMGKDMLGSFFIIMEKVEGQCMPERVVAGMTASEPEEVWRQFAGILADIHTLDWERAGLGFLDPPVGEYGFTNRGLSLVRDGELSKLAESLGLTPVLDWLEDHKPPSDHYVLLHGDYHPNNVLVQSGKIVAIVDWEAVSIGDAAFDVAEVPLVLRIINVPNEQLGKLVETFLEHYQDRTGRELRNLDYYQVAKAFQWLFVALLVPLVGEESEEVKELMLQACVRQIEEMTGLRLPPSLKAT